MKLVINRCFGGFGISDKAAKELNIENTVLHKFFRTDERLISLVEQDSKSASSNYAKLCVVEIPDNATDYEIADYDGCEEIIAVVDGKLVHIPE